MPNPQFVGTTKLAHQPAQPETYNERADREAYERACWHYLDHLFRHCCYRYPGDAELRALGDQVLVLCQRGGRS
jgi:hypothetical protein